MPSLRLLPTLSNLLRDVPHNIIHNETGQAPETLKISMIAADSRQPAPSGLFIALQGSSHDGHDYLDKAIVSGNKAVIVEKGKVSVSRLKQLPAIVIEVADSGFAYAQVSANFFGRPSQKLKFIGVTGTNGKTTVTYLLEEILLLNASSVGVIGTVNNRYTLKNGQKKILNTRFTTPEAYTLQQVLREMADAGVDFVIMEVSSHALAQSRIGAITFEAAAFTNLTRDHLDYHESMEEYLAAKVHLFAHYLREGGTAVLPLPNSEDEELAWQKQVYAVCNDTNKRIVSWGRDEHADVRLMQSESSLEGTGLTLKTANNTVTFTSPLVGEFNIENLIVAYSLAKALQVDDHAICKALDSALGAPGRLERVSVEEVWPSHGPVVLVDYAHTPDALEKVLRTAKKLPHRQLVCVFGCGGDRDKGKRPIMGAIAASICDLVVITDDNPRTEEPEQIVQQIIAGIETDFGAAKSLEWLDSRTRTGNAEKGYLIIRDRRQAISMAIRAAGAGDIVVIAGKGHETYQLTAGGKRFFDDRIEAKNALLSWTLDIIATAVGGNLTSRGLKNALLGQVVTDSRAETRDGVFIALKGENHDAHDYLRQAIDNGASCLLIEREPENLKNVSVGKIVVADTQKAFGDMAAYRRKCLSALCRQWIIGITGSCGKTAVKEMVAAILARKWPVGPDYPAESVLKTQGNFNNLIGLPISLMPLSLNNRAVVLEMGMNRPGELQRLAAIADPDISCITNIHGAHLEGLGTIEGVAKAKEELFAGTRPTGTLVYNLDDPWVARLYDKYPQQKVTFAVAEKTEPQKPDFWAADIVAGRAGDVTFTMHTPKGTLAIHLNTPGTHNVANALAAAAIASVTGAGDDEIITGLGDYRPSSKRMELLPSKYGFTILNDTYNANPASMAAGLRTLTQLSAGKMVAILGDMRELGNSSADAHQKIGLLAAELAIDHLGIIGEFKDFVRQGAISAGFPPGKIQSFTDKREAVVWIKDMVAAKNLGKDDLILVKASRGLRFETIVAELVDPEDR